MAGTERPGTLPGVRSVICDDEAFARLVGEGELYDYELGERYIVAPSPGGDHAVVQGKIIATLTVALPHLLVAGPTNLGVLAEPGQRWYVVPDVVVIGPAGPRGRNALLQAMVAVEIRSAREDVEAKLADYRAVTDRTGLAADEVWYVDGVDVSVHPRAGAEGATAFPEALQAVRVVVADWHRPQGAEPIE
jgi:hypothetical protein